MLTYCLFEGILGLHAMIMPSKVYLGLILLVRAFPELSVSLRFGAVDYLLGSFFLGSSFVAKNQQLGV